MPQIALASSLCSEANDIAPFLSLCSVLNVLAPRASRSVQASGDMGKKSQWQSVGVDAKFEGITLHLVDDEPKEMLSVMLRDFRVFKRQREIDVMVRLRSLQIDNMLVNAFYPIVLRSVDLGYDQRPELVSTEESETYLKRKLRQQNENASHLSDVERDKRLRALTHGRSRRSVIGSIGGQVSERSER